MQKFRQPLGRLRGPKYYYLLLQHNLKHPIPVINERLCYLVAVRILIPARMNLSFVEGKYL